MATKEQIKAALRNHITHERRSSFLNHFRTLFSQDAEYSGTIEESSFTIWRYNSWTGIFYSVVIGTFVPSSKDIKIKLRTKPNPLALFIMIVTLSGLGYGSLSIVISDGNFLSAPIERTFIGFILFCSLSVPLIAAYRIQREEILHEVEEIIKSVS